MIRKANERETTVVQKYGGNGTVSMSPIIFSNEELNNKGRLFSHITVEPGNEFGYHVHNGESEIYYVLAGKGEYNDNGNTVIIEKGDVTFTRSGEGHGVKSIGDEPLEVAALILFAD